MMCECAQIIIDEGSVFLLCTILIKLLFGFCSVQLVFLGNKKRIYSVLFGEKAAFVVCILPGSGNINKQIINIIQRVTSN